MLPQPFLQKIKFFLVNEVRTNTENCCTDSYKLRTNNEHVKKHTFLSEGVLW